ncbi:MAG: nitroreductase family protein [Lachnospiraceae bacterium]|nr:nitroreductase family protein [Lachnospiraceae bacterium]
MSFFDLVKERYSVRNFADRPVEEEKLYQILEAGRLAPTAMNEQPQRIFVLKSPEALAKVRKVTRMTYNAPVCMLDLGYPAEGYKPSPMHFSRLPLEATVKEL